MIYLNFRSGSPVNPFTDLVMGWSLRKIFTWDNAVLKIRRSSDNATAFLFFDGASASDLITTSSYISTTSNTTPDATTLATWLSTDDAFVVEWFGMTSDNIINSNYTVSQATTSAQAKIASAGVIITDNTKPAIDFDGGDHLFSTSTISELGVNLDYSIVSVSANDTSAGIGTVFCNSNAGSNRLAMFNDRRTNKLIFLAQTTASSYLLTSAVQYNTSNQKLLTITNNNKFISSYYNNGSESTDTFTGAYDNNYIRIGAQHGAGTKIDGRIQEILIFSNDITTQLTDLHSDINSYYSIY